MHLKTYSVAALLLIAVAGCSGGGSAMTGPLPQGAAAPLNSLREASIATEAQAQSMRFPEYVSSPADLLYVGNAGNNSITVYRHDVAGNAAPLRVIAGPNTGISNPGQLSEDAQGNLYVANGTSILVFAHGATGNVAPIRKLAGPLTGIHSVSTVTVDQSTGKIFTFDMYGGAGGQSSLLRFPPNATGNVAPFARSATGLPYAIELASDSTGNNIIESNEGFCCNPYTVGIETFQKQFPNNAATVMVYGIFSFHNIGVADDPATKTYLTNAGGIYRFFENTNGQGSYGGGAPSFNPAIVSIITSATNCGQLALGYLRNIYAVCGSGVNVYAHDSSGDVSPLRVLSGPATKMNKPYGIYEGQ